MQRYKLMKTGEIYTFIEDTGQGYFILKSSDNRLVKFSYLLYNFPEHFSKVV